MVAEVELTVKHYFSSFPLTTRLSLFIKLFESLKKKKHSISMSSFTQLIFKTKCGSRKYIHLKVWFSLWNEKYRGMIKIRPQPTVVILAKLKLYFCFMFVILAKICSYFNWAHTTFMISEILKVLIHYL